MRLKMKLTGFFFCLFMSFVLIFMSIYYYIIFSIYIKSHSDPIAHNYVDQDFAESNYKSVVKGYQHHQRIKGSPPVKPVLLTPVSGSDWLGSYSNQSSSPQLINDIKKFKEYILSELNRRESDAANILLHPEVRMNRYNVKYVGRKGIYAPSRNRLCSMDFKTISPTFPGLREKHLTEWFPRRSLARAIKEIMATDPEGSTDNGLKSNKYYSCGLVTNSGSLKGSKSGSAIDRHDLVLRFNDAPIDGFEDDVGSKSDIRILNSKLFSSKNFNISNSNYMDSKVIIVWDPYEYFVSKQRYAIPKMDYDFYKNFIQSVEFLRNNSSDFPLVYILDPETVWSAWNLLQSSSIRSLPKTPPSSGFLGLLFLMRHCNMITLYEYIPSIRITNFCHYYDNTTSSGCTFGDWHPLSTEKLYALSLNSASDFEIIAEGFIKVAGC